MRLNLERGQIATSRLGMNGVELQKRLENIQLRVLQEKNMLIADNPSWDIRNDVRITTLNNLFISLGRTRLGIQFLGELLDDDWFDKNSPGSTQELRIDQVVSFEKLIKYSFGMDFFTIAETAFRNFLRALDPSACNNGTGSFNAIYDCLLGSRQLNFLSDERAVAKELLTMSRLLRNLIHNSGTFFSENGQDKTIRYKGKTYTFKHRKRVSFAYWDLLLKLADDIYQLLVKIISHPNIKSLSHILDPYVTRN